MTLVARDCGHRLEQEPNHMIYSAAALGIKDSAVWQHCGAVLHNLGQSSSSAGVGRSGFVTRHGM